tara:strand:- start:102 stop:302 length:201 start_codon:yes stop_codon:yes gene_type:complete
MIRIEMQSKKVSQRASIGACKDHDYANKKIVIDSGDFVRADLCQHWSQLNEELKNDDLYIPVRFLP